MNVLFLGELFYPHGGGAELATYLYAKLVSESDCNVKVVTNLFPGERGKSKSGKLEIYRLPLLGFATLKYSLLGNPTPFFSGFFRRLFRWADVVYIPLYWYSAIPIAKAYGKPVVLHVHNYILSCPLGTLFDMSERKVCKRRNLLVCPPKCIVTHERVTGRKTKETVVSALLNSVSIHYIRSLAAMSDAIVCVSKAQRRLIEQGCGKLFHGKLHVIYNPIPDIPYIDINGKDFGYFGGYSIPKGFSVLYRATKILNSFLRKNVTVHATKLKGSHSNKSILRNVGFVPYGKLDEFDYENLYRRIRAVVVPSIWEEPLPYVVTEALLKGRIVIASNIGGIPEISEGCGGVELFQVGNHEQLAQRMLHVKELSKETIVELGIKNRQNIIKKFSNELSVKKFINLLTEIL